MTVNGFALGRNGGGNYPHNVEMADGILTIESVDSSHTAKIELGRTDISGSTLNIGNTDSSIRPTY